MKIFTKIIMIIAIIILIVLIGGVGFSIYRKVTYKPQNPIATMEVEGFGTMKIELYPELAPNTVENFIALANRGFYNGLTFHRIIADFMIQGGDKEGTGSGSVELSDLYDLDEVLNDKELFETILETFYDGVYENKENNIKIKTYSELKKAEKEGKDLNEIFKDFLNVEYSIKGEFSMNGYTQNSLRHDKGVISMARSDYSQMGLYEEGYNSAGSQFFIVTEDNSNLNGQYAPFGKVIEGLDVLDKIKSVEVKAKDDGDTESEETEDEGSSDEEISTPVNPPVIKSVTIDTFGETYKKPEVLKPFDYNQWLSDTYGFDTSTLE